MIVAAVDELSTADASKREGPQLIFSSHTITSFTRDLLDCLTSFLEVST